MITWMQKNKKYLVVTIWISTIAFVGAGFVGWGAYDMNSNRANSVAKVGNRSISVQDLNQKYGQLYDYYNNILDGKLTEEKAGEMGLQKMALDSAIRDGLLLNFADDLGLSTSDEDVVRYIASNENFFKDGKFDKNTYYDTLRRSRINPKDYEENLKRAILIDKLNEALRVGVSKTDIQMMSSSFGMQDTLAVKIISADENEVKVDENELKALWEKNKNNYLTKATYELDTLFVPMIELDANETAVSSYYTENKANYRDYEDKILPLEAVVDRVKKDFAMSETRSLALQRYADVKNGKIPTQTTMSFDEDNATFPLDDIKNAKAGDAFKPIVFGDGYIVGKLKAVVAPKPMSYEEARVAVEMIYMEDKFKSMLDERAKEAIKNFDPNTAVKVVVSKDSMADVEGLDTIESGNFIAQVFDSTNKKGFVVLGKKAAVYEILEQKLLTNNENSYNALALQNIEAIKNDELMQDLTKELMKRYKVEEYLKR